MKGIVLRNGAFKKCQDANTQLILEAIDKLKLDVSFVFSCDVVDEVNNNICDLFDGVDFVLCYDKDYPLIKRLENQGVKCFNTCECIKNCDNKSDMYTLFAKNNIRFAKTYIMPFLYKYDNSFVMSYADNVSKKLGFPLVAKSFYGAKGKSVFKINNIKEMLEVIEQFHGNGLLFQEYLYVDEQTPYDIRVNVIGNKALYGIKRVAQNGDFRSNIAIGGKGEQVVLTQEEKDISEKTALAFNCDFCGVDLIKTKDGIYVCEINSNPDFNMIKEVYGKNAFENLFQYIVDTINQKRCD